MIPNRFQDNEIHPPDDRGLPGLGSGAFGLGGSWSYYRCLIDSLPLPLRLFFYRKERTNFTQGKARR